MPTRRVTMLLHGFSGSGKSTLASTAPGPVLILDAESGSDWFEGVVYWLPAQEAPPNMDGYKYCVVNVLTYEDVVKAYEWLASGDHPFGSVVLDSISEIQQRCIDSIAGANQLKLTDWGELLRTVAGQIRKFRDLKSHPTNPLWAVIFVAMSEKDQTGKQVPLVQGKLKSFLPYYVDCCGWLYVETDDFGNEHRNLLIGPDPLYEAKERMGGRLPKIVTDPNVKDMLRVLNAKEKVS
jgi:hypothetical protein